MTRRGMGGWASYWITMFLQWHIGTLTMGYHKNEKVKLHLKEHSVESVCLGTVIWIYNQ